MSNLDYNDILARDPNMRARVDSVLRGRRQRVLSGPHDLGPIAAALIGKGEVEKLAVFAIDRRNRVVAKEVVSVGNNHCTIVDPAVILRWALTQEQPASVIAIAHNHPSGDVTPSDEDRQVTHRLVDACRIVGIRLIDHVVVSGLDWRSLAEEGVIPATTTLSCFAAEQS
jgi:DNA repair protein RadC